MSADRDQVRIVRAWLEEGVIVLPDRVLDAVLDQLPATKQVRPITGLTRYLNMSVSLPGLARFAVVAVVAAGAAVLGLSLMPKTTPGINPAASPTPTASVPLLTSNATTTTVPAGTYTVDVHPGAFQLTLGPGWHSLSNGTGFALLLRTEGGKPFGEAPNTVLLGVYVLGDLYRHPCRDARPTVDRPQTVAQAITALRNEARFTMTAPTVTQLGGREATTFDMDNSLTDVCSNGSSPHQLTYVNSPGLYSNVNNLGPGGHERFWLVQEDGAVVAIVAYSNPPSHPSPASEVDELYRATDSIRFP
jgi:hypothetical protein